MDNEAQASQPAPQQQAPTPPSNPQIKKSSNTLPLLGVFLGSLILLAGVIYYRSSNNSQSQPSYSVNQNADVKSYNTSPPPGKVTSSDSQLDQDSQAIDNSLNALNTDVSNVDKGLNDQSVDLSQ